MYKGNLYKVLSALNLFSAENLENQEMADCVAFETLHGPPTVPGL